MCPRSQLAVRGDTEAAVRVSGWIGGSGRGRRRGERRLRWRDAEGFVDGFEQDGHVDRLVDVGDGAGFESSIAIADGSARADDDNGDGAGVEEHLKALQDDEAVACGKAEVEENQVGLFFAGGADGGEAIARSHDFESGGFEAAGESRQLEVLILDNHDFLAGHYDSFLESKKAAGAGQDAFSLCLR
jgi:hypothetical protein